MTLLAAGVLAACQSDPMSPAASAAPGELAAHRGRSSRGPWRFNNDKYSDRGHRPATGRSGDAAIQAEVLVGAGGLTILRVESFRAGDLTSPAGDIERVQVRAFSPRGKILFVRVERVPGDGSVYLAAFPDLPQGVTFQVTAHVRGLDGRRTDVVTVGGIGVLKAPDLALTSIGLPSAVYTGTPTIITAVVEELNGDRGAQADCELEVNGRVADRARGIWIDAGDAVTCAFTVTFARTGLHELRVSLKRVRPHDAGRGNNGRSVTVDVQAPSSIAGAPPVTWGANVRWGTTASRDTFEVTLTAPDGSVFFQGANASRADGTVQEALLSAQIGTALPFPLTRLEVAQASGGVLLHGAAWDDVGPDAGGSVGVDCVARGAGTGTEFYLCANQLGFSSLTYRRAAGSVTYQSSEYSRVWNGATYDVDTYVTNVTDPLGAAVVPFGSTYTFDVRITTAGLTYGFGAVVPLGPVSEATGEPLSCSSFSLPLDGVVYGGRTCMASSTSFTGIAGSANGAGFLGNAPAGLRVVP